MEPLNLDPSSVSNLIHLKQESLIEKFVEATLVYRQNNANIDVCIGGGIHKLLETLNRAHIDVVISTGQESVLPLANDMAISLIGQELLAKPLEEQNQILSTWGQDNSVGFDFKNNLKISVRNKLKYHFAVLLTEQQLDDIVVAFEDAPRPPVPNAELNRKVDAVENIPPSGTEERKATLEAVKDYAREIYYQESSIDEKITRLNQLEDIFQRARIQLVSATH